MPAPLLFGGCKCGRNAIAADYQFVEAFVYFNVGFTSVIPGPYPPGNSIISAGDFFSFGNVTNFPPVVYLQGVGKCYDNLTGAFVGTQYQTFDKFGNITYSSDPSPISSPNGFYVIWSLAQPWTYQQAVADAVSLLEAVSLLSPGTVYPGGLRLAYGSEAIAYPGAQQQLYIGWTPAQAVVVGGAIVGYAGGSATPIIYSAAGCPVIVRPPFTSAFAANGAIVVEGGSGIINPAIFASKMATRTPTALLNQSTTIFTPGSPFSSYTNNAPTNAFPPGEYILDPGTVGGYGSISIA
ncbi:MAG: hypothetical protein KGJ13_03615 [Patescibacteria group bacterium]|nr:hypothetical protein [Patescibacteria group bacterium]